jgi:ubiquinol-cytochrome c reductase cytochrome c1 subunit
MDQDQRMECLRMAFELGGKTEPIISAAQQLFDFVHAKPQQTAELSTQPAPAEAPAAEQPPVSAEAPEPSVADAIAACGTALVMPEGGDLIDAVPSVEIAEASPPPTEPASQSQAGAEDLAAASAAEPASTNEPAVASASEAESPEPVAPVDDASQPVTSEVSAEQLIASDAGCEPTPADEETTPIENVESIPAEAVHASSPGASDDVAVTHPPEVSS